MLRRNNFALILCTALASGALLITGMVSAQTITQAYKTDTTLRRGMIVRISGSDKSKVEALTTATNDKMEGVVVAANDASVTLSDADPTKQQVFVATSGHYNVLVSTQNGSIATKDYLKISSLAGIGMRAGTTNTIVVGRALEAFDGKSNVSGTTTLKDSAGNSKTVQLGLIGVDIDVTRNPSRIEAKVLNIPGFNYLQNGAETVVNKPVGMARIYFALLVILLAAFISGSMLYSGVKSSVLAVGRNPLAKPSVLKNLFQVISISIIILIIGVCGVYLILKL